MNLFCRKNYNPRSFIDGFFYFYDVFNIWLEYIQETDYIYTRIEYWFYLSEFRPYECAFEKKTYYLIT
jgi:hypothetical protein